MLGNTNVQSTSYVGPFVGTLEDMRDCNAIQTLLTVVVNASEDCTVLSVGEAPDPPAHTV